MPEHGSGGPIEATARIIADEFEKQHRRPPREKNETRAYTGGFLAGASGYIIAFGPDLSSCPDMVRFGILGAAGLGCLLIVVGLRGSHGPRDMVGAFFAFALPVGGLAATVHWMPELLNEFYVRAFCAGIACANALRIWIAIRGPVAGSSKVLVQQEIADNVVQWQPVRRR